MTPTGCSAEGKCIMVRFPFSRRSKRGGITLIEVLVVLAIIAVLIGLSLAAVQNVRAAADRLRCSSKLYQIALAAHDYQSAHARFPTGAHPPVFVGDRPTGGINLWFELLPYLERDDLYKAWDSYDNRNNVGGMDAVSAQVIQMLLCPSDLGKRISLLKVGPPWTQGYYGLSSYGGNAGKRSFPAGPAPDYPSLTQDGIFWLDSCVRVTDISDGTTNTFLFGERFRYDPVYDRRIADLRPGSPPTLTEVGRWALIENAQAAMGQVALSTPVPINYRVPQDGDRQTLDNRVCAFGSGHPGGANFAFADGSVRFLRNSTPLLTLQALSTRAGGEAISDWDY